MGSRKRFVAQQLAAAAKLQARLAQLAFKGKHRPTVVGADGVLGNTGSQAQGN